MTAQRQASLYYARQRRRDQACLVPRQFTTRKISAGPEPTLDQAVLARPVTLQFVVNFDNISATSQIFSIGTSVICMRGPDDNLEIFVRGKMVVNVQDFPGGNQPVIFAIRPADRQCRCWGQAIQFPALPTNNLPELRWADVTDMPNTKGLTLPLNMYFGQIPRRFLRTGSSTSGQRPRDRVNVLGVVDGIPVDTSVLNALRSFNG